MTRWRVHSNVDLVEYYFDLILESTVYDDTVVSFIQFPIHLLFSYLFLLSYSFHLTRFNTNLSKQDFEFKNKSLFLHPVDCQLYIST